MTFPQIIRKLRIDAELGQQDVADKVGIARATYISLENARRDPKLGEIKCIAEYYEISPQDLIEGNYPVLNDVTPFVFGEIDNKNKRDPNPQIKPERLREVLLYVINKVGAKSNVGETVIYKLLYFIDFDYYEKTGRSITGMTYIRNHYGPTPSLTFEKIVKGMEARKDLEVITTKFFKNTQKKYLPRVKPVLNELSADELSHINQVLHRLSDKTATELSALSHKDMPWIVTKQGEPINYRYVFYRTDKTATTEPEDEL